MSRMLIALAVLFFLGCAAPVPGEVPEGVACVSTLTTTVVTIGKVSRPLRIDADCSIHVQ